MADIKQEPFSEDEWDQLIKNFENQPDAYFPEYQNASLHHEKLCAKDVNSNLDPAANVVKSEPIGNLDWAFINPADQPFEIPTDNVPRLHPATDQTLPRLDEIRALYDHHVSLDYHCSQFARLEENTR